MAGFQERWDFEVQYFKEIRYVCYLIIIPVELLANYSFSNLFMVTSYLTGSHVN